MDDEFYANYFIWELISLNLFIRPLNNCNFSGSLPLDS